jgi:FkbM family methyltransferase
MTKASADDQPFRHYSLKHRLIAWVSHNLFGSFTYTVRHGLITGLKRKGGLGWVPASLSQSIVSKEELFWRSLNLSGLVVYDVGAFEGLLTLFFARQARRVVCYEPNDRNHGRLTENIRLNRFDNIMVRKFGVGSQPGTLEMVSMPLMPGGASVEQRTAENLSTRADVVTQTISLTTLDGDSAATGLPDPDFIKIDIEGWELEALRGARGLLARCRPALFLEMHGETLNEKRHKVFEIVKFLEECGYAGNILHVETETQISQKNTKIAVEGHLFCDRAAGSIRRVG